MAEPFFIADCGLRIGRRGPPEREAFGTRRTSYFVPSTQYFGFAVHASTRRRSAGQHRTAGRCIPPVSYTLSLIPYLFSLPLGVRALRARSLFWGGYRGCGGRERCELSGIRQPTERSAVAREAFGQPVGCRLRSSVYPRGVEQRNWQWATARHRAVASIYSMLLQQSRQSSLTTWELKSLFKKRKGPKQTYATRLVFQGYFT